MFRIGTILVCMQRGNSLKNHQNEEKGCIFVYPGFFTRFCLENFPEKFTEKKNSETEAIGTLVAFWEVHEMTIKFNFTPS